MALVILGWWALTSPVQAYSYAGAGEDILMQARQSLLNAIDRGDAEGVEAALADMKDRTRFLEALAGPGLWQDLTGAARAQDLDATAEALNRIFVVDIRRRLTDAQVYIEHHQKAKNAVVRGQQLFEFIRPALAPDRASAGERALADALKALGQPGVFGVAGEAPDRDALRDAAERYEAAVEPWL